MSLISFTNYSSVAKSESASDTEVAGRYEFQLEAQRRILPDVQAKLDIKSSDKLLEIGCGPGNLLIPLSYFVNESAGIDNEAVLQRLRRRTGSNSEVDLLPGNFLTMNLPLKKFNKILIYSVIQYLGTKEEVFCFLNRALSLLEPEGRILVGDIPNSTKKQRYISTSIGKEPSLEWCQFTESAKNHPMSYLELDSTLVEVNDDLVLTLAAEARRAGFESYILQQPSDLPFGRTREDLLILSL